MKIITVIVFLLCFASVGSAQEVVSDEEDTLGKWEPALPDDDPVNWVDGSHAYATDQAQALTEWMDGFFGDPTYDLEQAESYLRMEFVNDWDEEDGNDTKVRLRGKVQLPKISKRVNLIFQGSDSEDLTEEERREEDRVAVQYELKTGTRSRVDLTAGFSSGHIRPGVRYRNEGSITARDSYRYVQRLQYEDGENFFLDTRVDLNRSLSQNTMMRWGSRVKWGEKTNGAEWRSSLSLRNRRFVDSERPMAMSYFLSLRGETRPDSYVKNYRVGVLWRRQVYRDYLFFELEPSYSLRRRTLDVQREGVWGVVLRLEIALERDLRRGR